MQTRLTPLAALLSAAIFTPVHAERLLEPVVVTASRFESAQQDRPIAAQVITAQEIRDSSATNVSEVLSKLGGVHTRINFTGLPDSPIDLRGFGMTGDQNTLILVNGQRLSENEGATARLSSIPMDAIERIEILRGSGAVQYGSGATAGTINIITKSPVGPGVSGSVFTQAGSHQSRDARGGFRIGGDLWGARIDAQHYESDNYRDNNRSKLGSVNGEFRLGNARDFIALTVNADDQKSRLPGARTEAQLKTDRRGAQSPDDFLNSRSELYALRGEKNFGDLTLALDASYRDKDATLLNKTDWGSSYRKWNTKVFGVSPRAMLNSDWGPVNNQLTIGADWSKWDYKSNTAATGFAQAFDERGKQTNKALYVRNELQLPTGTRLSLGGRKEFVDQSIDERVVPNANNARPNLTAHEIAIQQMIGAGFSVYGRTGRSFRLANIDDNRCQNTPCADLLKPQRSRDTEVGLEWQNAVASLRVGLFNMDVTDEIHYNALTFTNMNLSPTRHRGLELEGRVALWDSVDVAVNYTRTQATFREGTYNGVNVAGNRVPLVPKDRIGVNLGWQVTAATRATLYVQYVGSQRYDNDQANRFRSMPSYTITDFKISHQINNWRLAAGVNNLFDEKYYSYGIVNGSNTSFNAYPEDRRNFYASAEYRF